MVNEKLFIHPRKGFEGIWNRNVWDRIQPKRDTKISVPMELWTRALLFVGKEIKKAIGPDEQDLDQRDWLTKTYCTTQILIAISALGRILTSFYSLKRHEELINIWIGAKEEVRIWKGAKSRARNMLRSLILPNGRTASVLNLWSNGTPRESIDEPIMIHYQCDKCRNKKKEKYHKLEINENMFHVNFILKHVFLSRKRWNMIICTPPEDYAMTTIYLASLLLMEQGTIAISLPTGYFEPPGRKVEARTRRNPHLSTFKRKVKMKPYRIKELKRMNLYIADSKLQRGTLFMGHRGEKAPSYQIYIIRKNAKDGGELLDKPVIRERQGKLWPCSEKDTDSSEDIQLLV